MFTNVSCRVYTALDGRIRRVVELCGAEEEVIKVEKYGYNYLVSTSKCYLLCYSETLELKWKMQSNEHLK